MGRMSISALMKCTTDMRQFAYGSTTDALDEYLQMSENNARDALFFFNMCIIELYMPKYLRKPTSEDAVNMQQKHNNVHGFSEMLESIDSVASQDLWIWHAFYGIADANNDINVLDNSPLFDDLLDDLAPVVPYVRQESAWKDVERAFGVLQGRCGLIQQPARAYEVNTLRRIIHHVEVRVLLPSFPLAKSKDMLPFKLKRKQFLVRLSYVMSVNKAQGETIPNAGVYFSDSVVSHSQLYVAFSTRISRRTTKILVKPVKEFGYKGVYLSNVAYQEVLRDE
nr:hypothetical protein [Tanacetum cinerariifolium]